MFTNKLHEQAISQFEVVRAGKVLEKFASYQEAWDYMQKHRKGACVRYFIKGQKQTNK